MPILTTYTDCCGVVHTDAYWRLEQIAVDVVAQTATATFRPYVSDVARQAGYSPLLSAATATFTAATGFTTALAEINGGENGFTVAAEARLKEQAAFSDGTDC